MLARSARDPSAEEADATVSSVHALTLGSPRVSLGGGGDAETPRLVASLAAQLASQTELGCGGEARTTSEQSELDSRSTSLKAMLGISGLGSTPVDAAAVGSSDWSVIAFCVLLPPLPDGTSWFSSCL